MIAHSFRWRRVEPRMSHGSSGVPERMSRRLQSRDVTALLDWPMHSGGQRAETQAGDPDAVVVSQVGIQPAAEPDPAEAPDLMAQEHHSVEKRQIAGPKEHDHGPDVGGTVASHKNPIMALKIMTRASEMGINRNALMATRGPT